jgi:hypothetical protein
MAIEKWKRTQGVGPKVFPQGQLGRHDPGSARVGSVRYRQSHIIPLLSILPRIDRDVADRHHRCGTGRRCLYVLLRVILCIAGLVSLSHPLTVPIPNRPRFSTRYRTGHQRRIDGRGDSRSRASRKARPTHETNIVVDETIDSTRRLDRLRTQSWTGAPSIDSIGASGSAISSTCVCVVCCLDADHSCQKLTIRRKTIIRRSCRAVQSAVEAASIGQTRVDGERGPTAGIAHAIRQIDRTTGHYHDGASTDPELS